MSEIPEGVKEERLTFGKMFIGNIILETNLFATGISSKDITKLFWDMLGFKYGTRPCYDSHIFDKEMKYDGWEKWHWSLYRDDLPVSFDINELLEEVLDLIRECEERSILIRQIHIVVMERTITHHIHWQEHEAVRYSRRVEESGKTETNREDTQSKTSGPDIERKDTNPRGK
jgi:hypothetical protein